MTTDIYGEVNSLQDIKEINRKIRKEMSDVRGRDQLTELKKRADYLCTLTLAPSWKTRFGKKSAQFLRTAEKEDEMTTRKANEIARKKGFDVEYHAWRGG